VVLKQIISNFGGEIMKYKCPNCTHEFNELDFRGQGYGCPKCKYKQVEKFGFEIIKKEESIEETLEKRHETYGSFDNQACMSQDLKATMGLGVNWKDLPDTHREVLEMIALKISRILTGDYNDYDTWHDIIGYAKLIERNLKEKE
jgi:DNA-directed RNA polymerase subunit RPC12/RpoP